MSFALHRLAVLNQESHAAWHEAAASALDEGKPLSAAQAQEARRLAGEGARLAQDIDDEPWA